MNDTLFEATPDYPESVLISIYNAYPRKLGRPGALKRIREALDRICAGEIDGAARTQGQAIEFLRLKTEQFRREVGGREAKRIPHATTWFNQSRYLRPAIEGCELPRRLESCIEILGEYPTMPSADVIGTDPHAFLPALAAIDRALARMEAIRPYTKPERRLKSRTEIYAMAVKTWPESDLRYIPNPVKWYLECQYDQPESMWTRKPVNGFEQEREQLSQLLN